MHEFHPLLANTSRSLCDGVMLFGKPINPIENQGDCQPLAGGHHASPGLVTPRRNNAGTKLTVLPVFLKTYLSPPPVWRTDQPSRRCDPSQVSQNLEAGPEFRLGTPQAAQQETIRSSKHLFPIFRCSEPALCPISLPSRPSSLHRQRLRQILTVVAVQ